MFHKQKYLNGTNVSEPLRFCLIVFFEKSPIFIRFLRQNLTGPSSKKVFIMKKTSKNQTITLLDLLNDSELADLGKFLQSRFITAKTFMYPLYLKVRKAMKLGTIRPKTIFTRIFPKKPFNNHKWLKALSDLNACIEEFLVVQEVRNNPGLRQQAAVNAYFRRNNETLFRRAIDAALKTLPGKSASESADGWQLRFRTMKLAYTYPLTNRMKAPDNLLEELDESIEYYYFISKLQLACNRVTHAQFRNVENGQAPFGQLLGQTEALDHAGKSPLLTLYRALLHLLISKDAPLDPFFTLLKKHRKNVERGELESVVRFAFNYCIRRYREGETRAFGWYQQLFAWADAQGMWSESVVEEIFLNNGLLIAKSGEEDNFVAFLEKGKRALPPERRDDAVALLYAFRHFHRAEFEKAARLLNGQVDTRHPRYALLYHSLKVRNTYEELLLKNAGPDELERAIKSFKDFLQRDILAESLRKNYFNLLWFIRKMKQYDPKHGLSKTQLMEELKEKQPAVREWVIEKIGRLPG